MSPAASEPYGCKLFESRQSPLYSAPPRGDNPGMAKLIGYRRNPDLLDPAIALEVRDAIVAGKRHILPHLPESIRDVGPCLGTGHYGLVYETADPCWVLKPTTDPWEAMFAMVQRSGDIYLEPGVGVVFYAYVQHIKMLPKCRRPLFLVVRSAVTDLGFLMQGDQPRHTPQTHDLWEFKTLTENIANVMGMFNSPRRQADFKKRLLDYEWSLDEEKRDIDESHASLRAIAMSDEVESSSRAESRRIRSYYSKGDPEPELTLATAAKLVLAKLLAEENSSYGRGHESDVWKALNAYIGSNVLLADVHFGNIGRYTPECLPEEACSSRGWIISDPGHGALLDDDVAPDASRVDSPRNYEVLLPWSPE